VPADPISVPPADTLATSADTLAIAIDGILAGLADDLLIVCPSEPTRFRAASNGREIKADLPGADAVWSLSAVLLVADEISVDGDQAEELIATAADLLRPAGLLVLTAIAGPVPTRTVHRVAAARESPPPRREPRPFSPPELEHLLLHRGMAVERLEQHSGRLLAVGRSPVSARERTARFVSSLSFKLVTAAVIARDADGRVLCVFDRFRRHWTVPGGAVDSVEDPRTGALRETFEEAGVRVRATGLLGVFHAAGPDRLLLMYGAEPMDPLDPATTTPTTRQPHEIGEVVWLPVAEATNRLNPATRWQVRQCLDSPGETWRE
jgi:ADP-ribose pyrophosphatase YjhB (NUDIX family)